MSREYWLVWDDAKGTFGSNGGGIVGDFAQQEFGDGRRGLLVSFEAWRKNEGWTAAEIAGPLLAELSVRFAEEIAKGCASPKGRIQCDDQAQSRYLGALRLLEEMAARGQPVPPIKWTMWDRSQVTHNLAELKDMGLAMGVGFQAKMAARQAKEAVLRDPDATIAQIMAVDLASGWPE